MTADHTHITILLDRTGSMEIIRDDTIGGFNAFLEEQQATSGKATLTLVQFDSQDPYEVLCRMVPIAQVPTLTRETFVPRATTPLLDAMGRAINDLDASLAQKQPEGRPERIVMVVITDGQENASREFDGRTVKAMIEAHERAGWQFVFLSADLGSIDDAQGLAMRAQRTLAYDQDHQDVRNAMASASNRILQFRNRTNTQVAFDEADRGRQNAECRRSLSRNRQGH